MRGIPLFTLIFCLLAGIARATPDTRTMPGLVQSPGDQCRVAIAAAERAHGIPPQLLAAIGRVESGRRDPGTGAWGPWPWTINAEGQGSWFQTKAEAIGAVQALQASGVRSIDVGCMQVNLMHHPQAFPNLAMAFEPAVNADYAARFLLSLHGQTGDWTKATADYHSSNPAEGEPYAAKVVSVWPEEQRKAGQMPVTLPFASGRGGQFAMPIQRFAGRQPPRMMPLPGITPGAPPGVMGMGMPSGETAETGMGARGLSALGMMRPTGGQTAMNPGRGLDFYRAAPIRVTMPFRIAARMSNRVMR
jgi:hypothetical protein